MLKHLPALLTPDALHALASMGHGDLIAIVDANFPAARVAAEAGAALVQIPGANAPALLRAVLAVLPIDDFEPDPVRTMAVVGDPQAIPAPVVEFSAQLLAAGLPAPIALKRHAFYEAARAARAIFRSGELRPYGNVLLRKGVWTGDPA